MRKLRRGQSVDDDGGQRLTLAHLVDASVAALMALASSTAAGERFGGGPQGSIIFSISFFRSRATQTPSAAAAYTSMSWCPITVASVSR